MYKQIRNRLFASLLYGLAGFLLTAGSARAQTDVTTCGQILGQPGIYILTVDLDCSGTLANGINITVSDVTFHLGSHTLSSTDCDLTKDINGIFVPGSIAGVRIDGGTVRGFNDGIVLSSSKSRVRAMTVTGACQFGIAVQNHGNTVSTSRVTRNGVDGIGLQVATNAHISANDISDNLGYGVGVSNNSKHNFITYNILSRNGAGTQGGGVVISYGTDNTVANNSFDNNFDGIVLEDARNTVHANTISGGLDVGLYLAGSASPSRVTHNTVLGSDVSDMSDASPACGLNTWRGNTFNTDLVDHAPDGGPKSGCIR